MAIDVVEVCTTACNSSGTQGFFMGVTLLFAFYVGLDMAIALIAIRESLSVHNKTSVKVLGAQ